MKGHLHCEYQCDKRMNHGMQSYWDSHAERTWAFECEDYGKLQLGFWAGKIIIIKANKKSIKASLLAKIIIVTWGQASCTHMSLGLEASAEGIPALATSKLTQVGSSSTLIPGYPYP